MFIFNFLYTLELCWFQFCFDLLTKFIVLYRDVLLYRVFWFSMNDDFDFIWILFEFEWITPLHFWGQQHISFCTLFFICLLRFIKLSRCTIYKYLLILIIYINFFCYGVPMQYEENIMSTLDFWWIHLFFYVLLKRRYSLEWYFGGFNYELQTVKSVLFVCDLL